MEKKLTGLNRLLVLLCAIALLVVLFIPIWRIDLDAPQYPEGLHLNISANGISGNVDIINGLNHYIGMKTLHNSDFIEFTILPYIISFYALLFIAIAVINRRKLLNAGVLLFVLFGIIAMIDFWRWEYNYGHNLNPDAAIIVPGMYYQPPLIGFKQLLNFGAFSIPDIGGWIFIGVGAILLLCVISEFRKGKNEWISTGIPVVAAVFLLTFLSSCTATPEPIITGVDQCCYCRMVVSDPRFGAEIITVKGKKYKFDDMHCLLSFIHQQVIHPTEIKEVYLVDYAAAGHPLIQSATSLLLQSEAFKSPMNGNIAAFSEKGKRDQLMEAYKGSSVSWNQLIK